MRRRSYKIDKGGWGKGRKKREKFLGIFRRNPDGGEVISVQDRRKTNFVSAYSINDSVDGELVEAEEIGYRKRWGRGKTPEVRILKRLGGAFGKQGLSFIAIREHNLREEFSSEVMEEVENLNTGEDPNLVDLRHLSFVTIDPCDAKDHDDACFAEMDCDPNNKGGYLIWVAISDVSGFVKQGSALDGEAFKRGNSSYLLDRVLPMLPEEISNGICSLKAGKERRCLVVKIKVSNLGLVLKSDFRRAVIKSRAALSYESVEATLNGVGNEIPVRLAKGVIYPMFAAYQCLTKGLGHKSVLELEVSEKKVELCKGGQVKSVSMSNRLTSQKIIELFMIQANIAASRSLAKGNVDVIYRVHSSPQREKIENLENVLGTLGFKIEVKGNGDPAIFNKILRECRGSVSENIVSLAILRCMEQARYDSRNIGHFGLGQKAYVHFTSPIRRYADLAVHRALISLHGWESCELDLSGERRLSDVALHLTATERSSTVAERETENRYVALYYHSQKNSVFTGIINGLIRSGVFIRLNCTGAEGFIPLKYFECGHFRLNKNSTVLKSLSNGLRLCLGLEVEAKLIEITMESGKLLFEPLKIEGIRIKKTRYNALKKIS